MGTRSISGVRIDDRDRLTYNHFDGYPTGVGNEILKELTVLIAEYGYDAALGLMKGLARSLVMVEDIFESDRPTPAQLDKLRENREKNHSLLLVDLVVDQGGDGRDWYDVLRDDHGSILRRLASGFAINDNSFIRESLFCEWGYILNLDTEKLEVYVGFQKARHMNGRYASAVDSDGYYPCALIHEIPLPEIPRTKFREPTEDQLLRISVNGITAPAEPGE